MNFTGHSKSVRSLLSVLFTLLGVSACAAQPSSSTDEKIQLEPGEAADGANAPHADILERKRATANAIDATGGGEKTGELVAGSEAPLPNYIFRTTLLRRATFQTQGNLDTVLYLLKMDSNGREQVAGWADDQCEEGECERNALLQADLEPLVWYRLVVAGYGDRESGTFGLTASSTKVSQAGSCLFAANGTAEGFAYGSKLKIDATLTAPEATTSEGAEFAFPPAQFSQLIETPGVGGVYPNAAMLKDAFSVAGIEMDGDLATATAKLDNQAFYFVIYTNQEKFIFTKEISFSAAGKKYVVRYLREMDSQPRAAVIVDGMRTQCSVDADGAVITSN